MTDENANRDKQASTDPVAPAAESDGTITISIGLWPVLGLVIVIGGLLFGVWLARGGLAGLGSDSAETAEVPAAGDPADSGAVGGPGAVAPGNPVQPGAADAGAPAAPGAGGADQAAVPVSPPIEITAPDEIEVLALLDGEEITSRDIDIELIVQSAVRSQAGMTLNSDPDSIERFRREILEHVLDQRALISAADGAGMVVTDVEATAGIATMGSQLGVDGTELYETALEVGITDAHYLDWVRGQLAIERFLSSDEARQISVDAMVASGVPADQAATMPGNRETVAEKISADADIQLMIDGQPVTPVVIGEEAPDAELIGLDGQPFKLSEYRGKPLLLNFWATWCVPCRVEMPSLQRAHEQYGDDLTILGASVDEPAELVIEYADALGLTFPLALDPNADVARLYRVRAMPTTYIIDAEGIVVEGHRGAVRSDEELAPLLEKVLPSAQSMVR